MPDRTRSRSPLFPRSPSPPRDDRPLPQVLIEAVNISRQNIHNILRVSVELLEMFTNLTRTLEAMQNQEGHRTDNNRADSERERQGPYHPGRNSPDLPPRD